MTKRCWILALGLSVAACAEPKGVPAPKTAPAPSARQRTREESQELRRRALERKSLERVEGNAESSLVTGEVPEDILSDVLGDLEERTGGRRSDFKVLRAESVPWSDGSLGCPEPGQDYQQVPVNGFQILIAFQGTEYDYRASEQGLWVFCRGSGFER